MNMKTIRITLCCIALTFALTASSAKTKAPNIIYILADDMGYGDLSCYGQKDFTTPNLDKLAKNGMKFTEHYSGSTVCAPSRSTLMTGLHTGHTAIRGNKELKGREGQTPMPSEYLTIAEVLKSAGYTTGAFGKWGLGYIGSEGDPNNQGFDVFYGYNCQRMAHRYYPTHLWDNQKKDILEGNDWTNTKTYAPDKIQDRTLQFIEDNKDNPFFAYIPLVQPHAEMIAPDSLVNKFKGLFGEEKPYIGKPGGDYGPNLEYAQYCSQALPKATFVAMIYSIDKVVGEIVAKLKELGIEDNTLIMFASDNGPHDAGGQNPKFFNSAAGMRGFKRDLYEGGIKTAFIAQWPNKIKPGTQSEHISAFWDILPTCAEIAGVKIKNEIDGISFLPTLLGKKKQKTHDHLYWEFAAKGGRQAVRLGNWKGVWYDRAKGGKDLELYNLSTDWAEEHNLAAQNPKIVAQIKAIIAEEHIESEIFPFKIK